MNEGGNVNAIHCDERCTFDTMNELNTYLNPGRVLALLVVEAVFVHHPVSPYPLGSSAPVVH